MLSRRRYLLGALASIVVVAAVALFAFQVDIDGHAQTRRRTTPTAVPAGPTHDPSGNTTGTGADLAGVEPGTLTSDDFATAATNEPFAVKLADIVNQNRLGINFTWTARHRLTWSCSCRRDSRWSRPGFCRAKNALHVMMTNFMVYGLGMLGYFACRLRVPVRWRRRRRHRQLGRA